ncbi:MAG: hypothetical protein AB8H03_01240 [Saprospiraceae bacterium]
MKNNHHFMRSSSKILFVITLLLISIFPLKISNGCWSYAPYFVGYSILHPNISEGVIEKPFVFTYSYFGRNWAQDGFAEKKIDKNIEEWKNYFCGKPKLEDLSFIIYESSIEDLEKLRLRQVDANAIIPDTLKNNSFVQTFSQYKFPDFLDYLIFAKECEPHFQEYYAWKKNKPAFGNKKLLLAQGIENYNKVSDGFLKLRYGYQLLRLIWYTNGDVEKAYNNFIKPLSSIKSVIQNLSIERLGGWLSRSKNEQKSIYGNVLLSKSLIGNLDRGKNVFLSLNIKDQIEWDQTIAACENDEQRSLIHYLRALDKHSVALDDMKSMYKFHPKSKALEILMTREMQKIELKYLRKSVNSFKKWDEVSDPNYGIPSTHILKYIERIKPFVKMIASEKKCNNPAYWMMMDGYLEYLTHDHQVAQNIFQQAKTEVQKQTILHHQIELLEFANLLSLMNTMNEKMENQFEQIMKHNKAFVRQAQGSPDFFMEKIAALYAQDGAVGKAYLCNYDIYGLKFFPNSKDAKAVLALYDKPDKNDFEKYLLEDENIKTRNEIVDILGTSYLGEDQMEKAIEVFQTIPEFGEKFKSPFRTYIFQHQMEKKYPAIKNLSKLEIAQKVLDLKNEISLNPMTSATEHLALGNYHFNTSYFGYAWKVKDYFISTSSRNNKPNQFIYEDNGWVKGNKEFMDLSLARKHFKKVFDLTKAPELHAKATLMLSELEKINNYLKTVNDKNNKKHQSKYYLTRLENDYFETKFYEEYLKECAPYNEY